MDTRLPVQPNDTDQRAPVTAGRAMKKPYVAIVDDDSAFAAYLRTFLSLRGYEARCYTRGDELLASMKQTEAPDVVLLDVMMPGLDGMATLRALKASRPESQVIMLSGRNQASTIVEAVRLGAADYVVKPDDPEGLGEIALDVAIKNAIEKNRLVSELSELRQQLSDDEDRAVWGNSEKMRGIATVIEQVADSAVTVLIRGESGVGKELVARAIHQRSTRRNRPFVKVNCAALPAELLESELFGHERGAFTGAATTRIGKVEQADTGTLMLDDVGEIKRVVILQDEQLVVREIERNMQRAHAMAATPVAAAVMVGAGMPGGLGAALPPVSYAPPLPPPEVEIDDVEPVADEGTGESGGGSLATVAKAAAMKAERAAIEQTLRQVHWNRRKAAQILGVSYKTLLNKIKECGISRA